VTSVVTLLQLAYLRSCDVRYLSGDMVRVRMFWSAALLTLPAGRSETVSLSTLHFLFHSSCESCDCESELSKEIVILLYHSLAARIAQSV
jgi:hypothetical protein